jgi:hypothetical protein
MRAHAQRRLFIMLGIALASAGLAAAASAATRNPPHRIASANRHGASTLARPKFRPARGVAAQDAARLGALVGTECRGKADMPRNDHEWVVLCSNGKTFVVDTPHQAGTQAIECSLAGTGPQPACYP